ncbi:hypothetical protein KNE206_54910 [Kitasatospora sp. NE20-6]|uniref:GGDEF domain-containing protein n=1 Tax=Kitasatospora sp. NE20-6 TaxID=2859066 RepID=UPI0034DBAB70
MSTPLLVQALAALSVPAAAGTGLLGLRLRRSAARAAGREAALQGEVAGLRRERDELQRTASCDPLTGVWNYRHLQITLDKEIERARRAEAADERRPLALLMLEIAGFEAVVAERGRSRAGAVLRDLAQRLAVEIRRSDTLGRYGGEEFLVLLPDTGAEGAEQVAERLCWAVRRHRLLDSPDSGRTASGTCPDTDASVRGNGLTAAIGIAVLPRDGTHAALLLRAADRALAEARRAGGDCWRGAPVDPVPGSSAGPSARPGRRTPADALGGLAEHRAAGPAEGPAEAGRKPGSVSACVGEATLTSVGRARTAAASRVARDGI